MWLDHQVQALVSADGFIGHLFHVDCADFLALLAADSASILAHSLCFVDSQVWHIRGLFWIKSILLILLHI